MNRIYSLALTLIFVFVLLCGPAFCENTESYYTEPGGPLPVINQMPLYLFFLQPVPDKATVTERGKFVLNADYIVANITVSAFTPTGSINLLPEYKVEIDAEVSRFVFDLRYGIYDRAEISLELPFIFMGKGYLDDPIEGFEDGIGARTPRSRERQGSNNFEYYLKKDNAYVINRTSPAEGPGDAVLNLKYHLIDENRICPNVSVRGSVKFPTGSDSDLLGSGEFDYAGGILLDKKLFSDRLYLFAGGNAIAIEKPDELSELDMEDSLYTGTVGFEFFATKRLSVITQVIANTAPYPTTETNPMDNEGYDIALGVNYTVKEKSSISWRFAVVENISAASTPDVSFDLGLDWEF